MKEYIKKVRTAGLWIGNKIMLDICGIKPGEKVKITPELNKLTIEKIQINNNKK